jgi:hypothetical protein
MLLFFSGFLRIAQLYQKTCTVRDKFDITVGTAASYKTPYFTKSGINVGW